MKLVTDSGVDIIFPPETRNAIEVEIVPLRVSLDGKSYREGIDIEKTEFYNLLAATTNLPETSEPSAADFADTYRRLAKSDPEILSIHTSSGLSQTLNSAISGAAMTPEANVTHFDTRTLSVAAGWMVQAASKAIKAGWSAKEIVSLLRRIRAGTITIYTLDDLKYMINGGRISHMKGLIANFLDIKPVIGLEKSNGTLTQLGQERTFGGALKSLVKEIGKMHTSEKFRAQVVHASNFNSAAMLKGKIMLGFKAEWLPIGEMSLVLGAHTGPSMVGVAFADQSIFDEIPE
ncbi:MAG: DegV family protein [Chloroflexota bacterium]